MAERERSHTRPLGGRFVPTAQVMGAADVHRALVRMAHEVAERNGGLDDIILVGLQTGGVWLAQRIAEVLAETEEEPVPVGTLDVAFYRDDIGLRPVLPEAATEIPLDITGKTVILVDDVLFTGRTVRAALNALGDFGRAKSVHLAVMVDRGHRELPIRPDYVGKNLPTRRDEMVDVTEDGVSIGTLVAKLSSVSQAEQELATPPRVGVGPHLLSIADLGADGIAEVLRVAEAFAEVERRSIPKVPTLRGKVVATLFFEESTRTRLSFETAAKRLSADVLSLAVASSAVQKGESLRDTVETVEAMGIDAVILRHRSSGAPEQVARWVERAHVINAGDGWHEHPTQALVDCFTVRQVLAEAAGVEPASLGVSCFEGLRVVIVGDVRHSRVARSEVLAYAALGAEVVLSGPNSLLPASLEGWPVKVADDLDDAIGHADVVSLLRLQAERGSGSFVPSLREYTAGWGLTKDRVARLGAHAIVTHPGPMVRGVEIASDVADLPSVVVTRQVTNGVAVRMAVLFLLLGADSALEGLGSTRG